MEKDKTSEALMLAEDILKNIELNELLLDNICLKIARLARIIDDVNSAKYFSDASSSVGQIDGYIESAKIRLAAAKDPDVSVSSANTSQYVFNPVGNTFERNSITSGIDTQQKIRYDYKSVAYQYALNVYYGLRFSSIPQKLFEEIRINVDKKLTDIAPESIKKFLSVYKNLVSSNPEDWSNAVHSCRRIIKDVADNLYPYKSEIDVVDRHNKKIKVGPDNYINRLILFVEDSSSHENFIQIVGSSLEFLGNRLDAICSAASKGTHSEIKNRAEAERYIIYTYLILGDILTLRN